MKKIKGIKFNYSFLLLGLLAMILIVFTIAKPDTLWSLSVWKSMAMQFPEYGVFALGVMFCFISGNIDVSFVALGDLAAIIGCMYMIKASDAGTFGGNPGMIVLVGIVIAITVGIVGGFINGNLISRLGIPSILATLANQMVFRGLAIALTRGDAVTGIPLIYSEVGHTNVFGFIPMPLLIFIIVFLISAFLLKYTTYGKKLYMIGSNPKAARFSAINTTRMINATFIISGVMAAVGALLMVSTMNSAKADYGSSYLMRSILILVLAGVLPDGGMGKIINVLISIVIIQIIASSVNMFPQLNTYYSSLISAVMLLTMLMVTTRLLGERKHKRADKKALNKSSG